MLYRFKSQASAELILLEPAARQILEIIGKSAAASGVITVAQLPHAITALEAAVADEARQGTAPAAAPTAGEGPGSAGADDGPPVALHQRATPFLHLLRESLAEKEDVVWGV